LDWGFTIPHTSVTLLQVITAAIVLVAGLFAVKLIVLLFKRQAGRSSLSDVLVEFLARFLSILLYVVLILLVLSTVGVTIGSLMLSLSAILGLILGFGMQDTVNNIASGTWIAALRPIDIGEVVRINDKTGKVNAVGILATELLTYDNVFITIPNGEVWGSTIENYTRMPTRRVDVDVGIAYGEDVGAAIQVAMDLMRKHELVLGDPEPSVFVTELAGSSINLQLRPWAKTENYWPVKGDIRTGIYEGLGTAGIVIPFPQLDVHMKER
jgi:small conductance mechanosensitive channel